MILSSVASLEAALCSCIYVSCLPPAVWLKLFESPLCQCPTRPPGKRLDAAALASAMSSCNIRFQIRMSLQRQMRGLPVSMTACAACPSHSGLKDHGTAAWQNCQMRSYMANLRLAKNQAKCAARLQYSVSPGFCHKVFFWQVMQVPQCFVAHAN